MGDRTAASVALSNSLRLLKTAAALHRLGTYALDSGNYELARNYLKQAAGSDSEEGRAAYRQLLQIDLPEHANQYLTARLIQMKKGAVALMISNSTPFPMTGVEITLSTVTGQVRYAVPAVIPASSFRILPLDSKIVSRLRSSEVRVTAASLASQ